MFVHPAYMMLLVWVSAGLSFYVLPYVFVDRYFSIDGLLGLFLFLFSFCFGALLRTPPLTGNPILPDRPAQFGMISSLLSFVSISSVILFSLDMFQHGALSLSALTVHRDIQAQALLHGAPSTSSIFFKIAFLLYPAGYSYAAICIIMKKHVPIFRLSLFGLAPGVLASLAMGGRTPLLCTLLILGISFAVRLRLHPKPFSEGVMRSGVFPFIVKITAAFLAAAAFAYFSKVFLLRAQAMGGASAMLDNAADLWGVTFEGTAADAMLKWFGDAVTYLIFVFSWYFNQGFLISTQILASYHGNPLYGAYGIDLFSAVLRRVTPDWLSAQFEYLLTLGTYGFYPSAFGSLYIDLGYFGLLFSFMWGWASGTVYEKVRMGDDVRFHFLYPFVVMGIILSLINTPLGVGNGFVTYLWLLASFFAMKDRSTPTKIVDALE